MEEEGCTIIDNTPMSVPALVIETCEDDPSVVDVDTGEGPIRRFKGEVIEALTASGMTRFAESLSSNGWIDVQPTKGQLEAFKIWLAAP